MYTLWYTLPFDPQNPAWEWGDRLSSNTQRSRLARDCRNILLGTAIYALGVCLFTAPNQIAPGGVSGLATVLHHLAGWPIGLVTALINIPLIVSGWKRLGHGFIGRTMLSVAVFGVLCDNLYTHLPVYVGNPLLAGIFGGVLIGVGVGLTFLGEGSTGGLDISSKMIHKRYPHFRIGLLIFATDLAVIAFSAVAYRNIDAALYATISMYIQARFIDLVLYGADNGRLMVIITCRGEEIAARILSTMDRGVTKIASEGAFSKCANQTLLCAVRQNEYPRLKELVREIDPAAFLVATTANEVVGDGFKAIDAE